MPGFPLPGRPGSELGEPLLDALLDRQSLPLDAPEEARLVAEMLADLTGPAEPGELAGEAVARLGLARAPSPAGLSPAARRRTRRRSWPSRSVRPAAALLAVAVALTGGAAAAYAGALPPPIQDFAHRAIGAPPAHRAEPRKPQPGPARSGPKARPAARSVMPGEAKGHRTSLPAQARGKARGHAWPGRPEPRRWAEGKQCHDAGGPHARARHLTRLCQPQPWGPGGRPRQ